MENCHEKIEKLCKVYDASEVSGGEAEEASLAIFHFDLDFIHIPGMVVIPTRAVNKVVNADSVCRLGLHLERSFQPKKRARGRV